MNIWDSVKQAVTAREAAEYYGMEINRAGMCLCPFHSERTPSMKVDERFHCFGCGAYVIGNIHDNPEMLE